MLSFGKTFFQRQMKLLPTTQVLFMNEHLMIEPNGIIPMKKKEVDYLNSEVKTLYSDNFILLYIQGNVIHIYCSVGRKMFSYNSLTLF